VARTDVLLPSCYTDRKGMGDDDDGGGGEAATNNNDNNATHAKVFAVFDGHGGAETARYCQINLVPVLTSQSHWKGAMNNGAGNQNKSTAYCIGQSLVDSFHALDRLIDDPRERPELDKWRSERPPPYVAGADVVMTGAESDENRAVQNEPMELEDAQQRRHTVMDASEIAEDAAKLHMLDDGENESDEGDSKKTGESTNNEGGAKKNLSSMLDADNDDEGEVFEDGLENKVSDGVVNDDSDDEKTNENDDGEVEKPLSASSDTGGKVKGKMVLAANDAVALFQKMLHMNGSDEDDVDVKEIDGEQAAAVNGDGSAQGESEGGEETDVVIPTRAQLLNPPTGIVAPSASVPTRIQNGRKICNLPDHPIHAGCTSVVAVVVGRSLVVANAGDSRAVICRAGGLTEPLSFDHKPLQNREMNRITNAGGFVNQFGRVNGNLNLSRSIGDLKYKQVPGIHPAEQMITAEPDILRFVLLIILNRLLLLALPRSINLNM